MGGAFVINPVAQARGWQLPRQDQASRLAARPRPGSIGVLARWPPRVRTVERFPRRRAPPGTPRLSRGQGARCPPLAPPATQCRSTEAAYHTPRGAALTPSPAGRDSATQKLKRDDGSGNGSEHEKEPAVWRTDAELV